MKLANSHVLSIIQKEIFLLVCLGELHISFYNTIMPFLSRNDIYLMECMCHN